MDVSAVRKPPVQSVQAAKRPEPAQQAQSQEAKPKPAEAKKYSEAKPPAPVVNAQGQTTGRLLNVKA